MKLLWLTKANEITKTESEEILSLAEINKNNN